MQERTQALACVETVCRQDLCNVFAAQKYDWVLVFPHFFVRLAAHDRGRDQDAELPVPYARNQARHLANPYRVRPFTVQGRAITFCLKRELGIDGIIAKPEQIAPTASRPPSTDARVISSTMTR